MLNIEIISGSPRKESVTVRVAKHIFNELRKKQELNVGLIDLKEVEVPFVQKVWTSLEKVPEQFHGIGKRVFEADAFILVSPEYNGGYSPALKNFLDHFPKQSHKVFGLATASPGAMGGMRAAQQLILMGTAFFGIVSPQLLITPAVDKKFTADGSLIDEAFKKNIDFFLDEFLWLAHKISK